MDSGLTDQYGVDNKKEKKKNSRGSKTIKGRGAIWVFIVFVVAV